MEPDKKNDSKFFFKIGELVEITGIPSSKIRYWTKKYKELASQLRTNDETSHKLYHKNSIEIILEIDKYMKNLEILSNNENINQKLNKKLRTQVEVIQKLKKLRDKLRNLINVSL